MKQKFTLIAIVFLFLSAGLQAQSFGVQYDTLFSNPAIGAAVTLENGITATTGTVTVNWKVIASDFPADWVNTFCICDNGACVPLTTLWSVTMGTLATETSQPYPTAGSHAYGGDFHLLSGLNSSSSTGCHYITVRLENQAIPADKLYETYMVCNNGTTATSNISGHADGNIILYPNPAHDEINVVYDAAYDIKNIVAYNVIGKILAVYKTTNNNSANLDIENMPPGLYFLRFMNSAGEIVVTKKFTKQ